MRQKRKQLGWKPTYTFESLVKEMVDSDLEALSRGQGSRG
jgi:GDP-D-mannose dehydratase